MTRIGPGTATAGLWVVFLALAAAHTAGRLSVNAPLCTNETAAGAPHGAHERTIENRPCRRFVPARFSRRRRRLPPVSHDASAPNRPLLARPARNPDRPWRCRRSCPFAGTGW